MNSSYELYKKITSVYISNMRFKLKNDCVCRFIAEKYNFSSVSILLYESRSDALLNFGNYLDVQSADVKFEENSKIAPIIIENISLFEYLASKYETQMIRESNFSDFKKSNFDVEHIYTNGNKRLLGQAEFKRLKKNFMLKTNNNDHPPQYSNYLSYKKSICDEDRYDLNDPKTISGKYFHELVLNSRSIGNKKLKKSNSMEIATQNKILNKAYDRLNIKIARDYNYFAIPLNSNGRYIGLIRFLNYVDLSNCKDDKSRKHELKKESEKLSGDDGLEIIGLADTIACFIGNEYNSYEFKRQSTKRIVDYMSYAELLSGAINSKSCIIRASDNRFKASSIIGWTDSINNYVIAIREMHSDHFITHEKELRKLFGPQTSKDGIEKQIIAVQFDVNNVDIQNIKYFYFQGHEFIRTTNTVKHKTGLIQLHNIFDQNIISKLFDTHIKQVMIVKVPYVDDAYVTFANTKFRKFILEDLDLIYPQINRLGSDLQKAQTTLLTAGYELLNITYHDLQPPLDILLQNIKTLNDTINEYLNETDVDIVKDKIIKQLNYYQSNRKILPKILEYPAKHINYRLSQSNLQLVLDQTSKIARATKKIKLFDVIELLSFTFEGTAARKKLKIIINPYNKKSRSRNLVEDEFIGLFFYLMDNAIKYSFELDKRKLELKSYSESEPSEGDVFVDYFDQDNYYGYSITNWGKCISLNDIERIFEKGYRGESDLNFELNRFSTRGEGLGLFYARILANKMKAKLFVNPESPKKNKFTVQWKSR